MRWFTSDWHFGHRKVIEYCDRPFKDVEEMTPKLIELWNNTVAKDDTVYFLGDFSLNPRWSRDIAPKLNGRKILIPGNHDACFKLPPKIDTPDCVEATKKRHEKMCRRYKEDGWEAIHQTMPLELSNGVIVMLSHLPYATREGMQYDRRYQALRPKDEGSILLHGHLHSKYRKFGRMIDVGIDGDMKLWSEEEIIKLIEDPRDFIPTPITEFHKNRQAEGV